MSKNKAEFCFSDIVIEDNSSGKTLRYYMKNYFKKWIFRVGWMQPHHTCFINKSLFGEFEMYSIVYKIAGDFDFSVRIFYGRSIHLTYLNRISVRMSQGGISNSGWQNKRLIFNEISRSLKSNNIWSLSVFQSMRYLICLLGILKTPKKGSYD